MDSLEKKIQALKEEHKVQILSEKFSDEITRMFPNIKTLSYIKEWNGMKKTANFDLENEGDFKHVFNIFKPTNKEVVIGYAGKDSTVLKTPYRIDLENPPQTSRYSRFEMKIDYVSNDINLRIKIPIELVKDFVMRSSRKITSSEYHYFTGVSQSELYRMDVMSYTYNTNDYIGWYGGNKTLTSTDVINKIINHLTK